MLTLSTLFIFRSAGTYKPEAASSIDFSFILLSTYSCNLNIGDELVLIAFTSTGKRATFQSSNSSVASVNTYGIITAKKSGTATITAKIKNAEAKCYVTIQKTKLTLNKTSLSLERNETDTLRAYTKSTAPVLWKCNKKSIATIDENGVVTAIKPGEAIITAKVDGTESKCRITVKKPKIEFNKNKIALYRKESYLLRANVSSGVAPTWKSSKKSVAIVDENGRITAVKNGTAIITATVDGVSKRCEVIVKKPTISISATNLTLKIGESRVITAHASSGIIPEYSTSNSSIVSVTSSGKITGLDKGKAYIYASEDGVKRRCTITVTE